MTIPARINSFPLEDVASAMRNAPAFPHFCIDNFLEASFAEAALAEFPSYAEAQQMGRSFDAVNERRKTQITDAKSFPPTLRRLHELMASDEVVAMMSQLSGITGLIADPNLMGGGIHETDKGGHLDVHVDFNFNKDLGLFRRLNVLIYFNKDWHEEWGGILDLWDRDVTTCIGRFAPVFNRAAGFATSDYSWHGVTPLTCPQGVTRKSFAVYYYTKDPAPDWEGQTYSTIFSARPDEYWKGAVSMPAEKARRAAGESIREIKRGLKKLLTP